MKCLTFCAPLLILFVGNATISQVIEAPPQGEKLSDKNPEFQLPELGERIPVTGKPLLNDPDNFQFLIVSDNSGGSRKGIFLKGIRKANLVQPEFVISVGDLIEGYTDDREQVEREWDAFDKQLQELEAPFFYVPGNHDITNDMMDKIWHERYGRTYYHFLYKEALFLCLNTEDGDLGRLADEQIAYALDVIKKHTKVRWTFVFMHEPIWHDGYGEKRRHWEPIKNALANRDYTVFAGHWHSYRRDVIDDHRYYILATTGGGSRLRGESWGEIDHLVWVTMTDKGPRIANLKLDGILPEDFLTSDQYNHAYELQSSYSISIDPLRLTAGPFEKANLVLRIENRADIPMRIQGGFQESGPIHIHPHAINLTIKSGETYLQPISFMSMSGPLEGHLPSPTLVGNISWEPKEYDKPLSAKIRVSAPIYRMLPLELSQRQIVIDGDLSDWKEMSYVVNETSAHLQESNKTTSWMGDGDLSYRFSTTYDRDAFYIAIQVVDDQLIRDPKSQVWEQDGIEIRFDSRDDPLRSLNTARHEDIGMSHWLIAVSPETPDNKQQIYAPHKLPKEISIASKTTENGYTTEVRIPNRVLNAMRNDTAWNALRLNLAVDDVDQREGPRAQLWWQPDWRSKQNHPGSGTFSKPR